MTASICTYAVSSNFVFFFTILSAIFTSNTVVSTRLASKSEECTKKSMNLTSKYDLDPRRKTPIHESCWNESSNSCMEQAKIDPCFGRDENERLACKIKVDDEFEFSWISEFHTCFDSGKNCYNWTEYLNYNACFRDDDVENIVENTDNTGLEAGVSIGILAGIGILVLVVLFVIAYLACNVGAVFSTLAEITIVHILSLLFLAFTVNTVIPITHILRIESS